MADVAPEVVLQLYGTPRSHFARKVRLLLAALEVAVELIDAGDVAVQESACFGGNPLLRVPTLVDGGQAIFDSDVIACHLVRRLDPDDRFAVLDTATGTLNARTVMNGIMAAEVELILGARTGMDTSACRRCEKWRQVIASGLSWLERHVAIFPAAPSYLGFHLVAMWDHLVFFDNLPPLALRRLEDEVRRLSALPGVQATRPR